MQHIVQNMEVRYSAFVKTFAHFAVSIQFQRAEILGFNFVLSRCHISIEKIFFSKSCVKWFPFISTLGEVHTLINSRQ